MGSVSTGRSKRAASRPHGRAPSPKRRRNVASTEDAGLVGGYNAYPGGTPREEFRRVLDDLDQQDEDLYQQLDDVMGQRLRAFVHYFNAQLRAEGFQLQFNPDGQLRRGMYFHPPTYFQQLTLIYNRL